MGNIISSATPPSTTTAGIDSYVSEVPSVLYERSLGSARFLKTIRCRHPEGPIVVKIFVKPEISVSLRQWVKELQNQRDVLLEIPNCFPYQRIFETERAGYLIRQYFFSSLYDRISTRPFLTLAEKKWIAFQILSGLAGAHAHHIYHGDIKTENVLVTSWNWAYLADFSPFKPTYLPEDNPADFSFFFDTSSRRACYIAPERFCAPGENLFGDKDAEGRVTAAMDIFSMGCTIAELFLEGSPLFTFPQLLRYRNKEYEPTADLAKIEDEHIRNIVKQMIQLDPTKRSSAESYLSRGRGTAFPEYFYSFLHQYVASVTDPASATPLAVTLPSTYDSMGVMSAGTTPGSLDSKWVVPDADAKIERIYADFGKIAVALGMGGTDGGASRRPSAVKDESKTEQPGGMAGDPIRQGTNNASLLPVNLNIPNYAVSSVSIKPRAEAADGCLIFTSIVCSCIRNTLYPSSKLFALDLLLALSIHLSDEHRLDRVVPYLVSLLSDEAAIVRATTVKILTEIIWMVESISTGDANIFPEYILPNLRRFTSDSEVFVRATYAQCIASLAETAKRFLDLSATLRSSDPDSDSSLTAPPHDVLLRDLLDMVQDEVGTLLVDTEPAVKRALLSEMPRLCILFGKQKTNDVFLSHMITYLNDLEWQLRSAFFESVVGVGMFVGARSLEEYILPLMIQALTGKQKENVSAKILLEHSFISGPRFKDSEEFVVERVLNSLTSLAEVKLIQKVKLKELASLILPLLCHPNVWLRHGALAFIVSVARLLPLIDVRCVIYPQLRTFLKGDIPEITELAIMDCLKEPVGRVLYDQALQHSSKSAAPARPDIGMRSLTDLESSRDSNDEAATGKTAERHDLEKKLREHGMTDEDKEKLFAMKYYIFKSTQAKSRKSPPSNAVNRLFTEETELKFGTINLKAFGITPRNEFLYPPKNYSGAGKDSQFEQPKALSQLSRLATESNIRTETRRSDSPNPTSQPTSPHRQTHPDLPIMSPSRNLHPAAATSSTGAANNNTPEKGSAEFFSPLSAAGGSEDGASSLSLISGGKSYSNVMVGRGAQVKLPAAVAVSGETARGMIDIHGSGGGGGSSSSSSVPMDRGHSKKASIVDPSDSERLMNMVNGGGGSNSGSGNNHRASLKEDPRSSPFAGRERNIKRLLEKKTYELFPPPIPELGPKVATSTFSMSSRQRRAGGGSGSAASSNPNDIKEWRPEGTLVAHLTEHKGPITQIRVAPDHAFFASASTDGSVKIWDSLRLERNVTNKARLTYRQGELSISFNMYFFGGEVRSIAFCEGTHSIASASTNGTIDVCRIEYLQKSNSPKYHGYIPVRHFQLEEGESAVCMEHYDTEMESVLVYATSRGKLVGLDLRSSRPAWTFTSPAHHGALTALTLDRRRAWALTGTERGIMSLWDIRFGIRVRSWGHPAKARIHRLEPYTAPAYGLASSISASATGSNAISNGSTKFALVAVQGRNCEVSAWDLEAAECREVWCLVGSGSNTTSNSNSNSNPTHGGLTSANADAINVNNASGSNNNSSNSSTTADPAEEMQRMYGNGMKARQPPSQSDFDGVPALFAPEAINNYDNSVRAIVSQPDLPFLLTGGTDRKIRLWDTVNVELSNVVSGLDVDDLAPRYASHEYANVTFNLEYTQSHLYGAGVINNTNNQRRPGTGRSISGTGSGNSNNRSTHSSAGGNSMGADARFLSGLGIGLAASPSLTSHLDAIVDLGVLRVPYPLLVSGDRQGVIKVWK
ncbi:hypothetical protein SmJEL517_g01766 [Synchytrium microbalum]|uniref:non-specific serine/threonine protein kinase n=1 Tax=Synchytrium microbalum TaxID=1806994 RepID=A0A507C4M7_9FUNG|nr:uncharacterized protein SmJEL517_g01766 [Synchytrium microbalum]TPX35937.1 hypothetical protein SmJEL517_g01766 [Synchytrium microbalum]